MAFFDPNTNPFEGMNIFGAKPSEALTGVLKEDPNALEKLKNQSLLQGILGAGATYLAQPKNQNVGLTSILGKSFLGGMQSSQGAYDAALKGKLDTLNLQKTQKELEMAGVPEFQKLLMYKNSLKTDSPTYQADLKAINDKIAKESSWQPPTTQVIMGQEKAENKAVGEFFGKQFADIQSAGASATNKINKVERLNVLLEGVQTGKLTPLGVDVASTASSLGFKIDPKLGNKQAADALSKEMALELRNPSGGAGMPGALSNSDREFLMSITPGLTADPEARKLISESMVKLAKRDQEVAKLARDYRKRKGNLDEGFYDELAKFSDANPLFTKTNKTIEVKY